MALVVWIVLTVGFVPWLRWMSGRSERRRTDMARRIVDQLGLAHDLRWGGHDAEADIIEQQAMREWKEWRERYG